MTLTIGTATAKPGALSYGWLEGIDLPTGGMDRLPVVIASGRNPGPVLWMTAGVHGDEPTGVIVLHRLLTKELVETLHGTVVAVLTMNPAGLRTGKRAPYYLDTDPNRLFPDPRARLSPAEGGPDEDEPTPLELIYQQLFTMIASTAPSGLIDLHNATIGSMPFTFRDPVFYSRQGKGRTFGEASLLNDRVGKLAETLGFPIVNEFPSESYVRKRLHRSLSGSIVSGLGVPAVTVELGSWMHIDPGIVEQAVPALRNVLHDFGMLNDQRPTDRNTPTSRYPYPVRRHLYPRAPVAGIVDLLVRPGEPVSVGQPLAIMRDIHGVEVGPGGGIIQSDYEGFVLYWRHGIACYQGDALMMLAVHDDSPMVIPYPD